MFSRFPALLAASLLVQACGIAMDTDEFKQGAKSGSEHDRTLADDVGGKLIKANFVEANCGSAKLQIPGLATLTGERKSVTCPWQISASDSFVSHATLDQVQNDFVFQITNSDVAGIALIDVKIAIEHGDFITSDYSVNLSATNGVTFYKVGNQYRNGPEHQVLYRASVPYAAGQKFVSSRVTMRNLQIKDSNRISLTPALRIRRNQSTPTDLLGGGPVRYESIMDVILIR